MNPYEVLGVSKSATKEEIRAAFKEKAVQYHPDKTNGDKSKEETFKNINEAYSILSDPQKKQEYDTFGHGGGPPPGDHGDPFADILASMFGGGMPGGHFSFNFNQARPKRADVIGIGLTINDMYHGTTKKVEFEMMDKCQKCSGSGAADPSTVVKCRVCNGIGMVHQRVNQFMMTQTTCPSCSGKGEMRTGKACGGCKGAKTCYRKRAFELNLPKGLNTNTETRMDGKGSYDPDSDSYNDIVFKFKYDIPAEYKIDESNGNVTYTHSITIDDLISGFDHKVSVYSNVEIPLSSSYYFNPDTKAVKIPGKGMFLPNKNKSGDLFINFKVLWTEGEKLIKYREVFQKIYKRTPSESTEAVQV